MTDSTSIPSKRQLLIDATLRVIARDGFRAVTHRKIAAEAQVSLSATSYHLSNMESILFDSMVCFVERLRQQYIPEFNDFSTAEATARSIVGMVLAINQQPDDITITYELFAQAARDPKYRQLVKEWSGSTLSAVGAHYSQTVALRAVTALEGLILMRSLFEHPIDEQMMYDFIYSILAVDK